VSVLHIGSLTTRASSPWLPRIPGLLRHSHVHPCVLSPLVSHGETPRDTVYTHRKATEKNQLSFSFSASPRDPLRLRASPFRAIKVAPRRLASPPPRSADSSAFYYWPHYPRGHEPCAFHPLPRFHSTPLTRIFSSERTPLLLQHILLRIHRNAAIIIADVRLYHVLQPSR